jgi:hypothetical protein
MRGLLSALRALGAFCAALLAAAAPPAAAAPLALLSEVMASDNTAFPDEDGEYGDWIELVNAGDAAAALEGWGLSDDPAEPLKWTFPAVTLAPGEHLVVWASDKDRRPPRKPSDAPLVVLPSNTVWRYRDNGLAPDAGWQTSAYDDAAWPAGEAMLGYGASQKTTISYGPNSSSKYPAAYFRQTFTLPLELDEIRGSGVLRLWADDGAVVYLNGQEILRVRMPPGPPTHLTYASAIVDARGKWETFEVPVSALTAGGNVLAAEIHQVNATSSDLCFWAELAVRTSGLHANFKISAGNETVTLSDAAGAAVDTAPALSVVRDASYGRAAGDPDGPWLMFPVPTPGAANSGAGYAGLLDPPAFSVAPGFYENPVTVALSHPDPEARIYYTLDGSTPTNVATATCFLYAAPLALADRSSQPNGDSMIPTNPPEMTNHTMYGWMEPRGLVPKVSVVRAAAFRTGFFSPRGAAGTWLIGGAPIQHTLRVFSLMADRDDLFGGPRGLFVPGDVYTTLGWNGHSVGQPNANYFQKGDAWERPVHVQMFEADRTLAFSQQMGARNHGGWSRAAAQKTLRLYARAEYGDSRVRCRLFPEQTDADFKRFLLRNSGNDWSNTGFRDALMQRMFRPLARTDTQDYEPAVVYVNGEYWGIQNIREHYSRFLLERKYGVDPDNLDLLKATAGSEAMEIDEGDDLAYKELLAYVKTNDLSQAEHYAWVEQRMDLDNLIDHYACEIYVCNTDWPGNNLGVWRVRTPYNPSAPYGHDGRWRWLIYDTDHGFGQSSSESTDMMTQARRSSRGVCQPHFNRLLANADFRNRFVNRFADLLNTAFKPARVVGIIDEAAARVAGEMPRHIDRWPRLGSYSGWLTRVQRMRAFANGRPAPALANLVNEFGLGGTASLTVDITNGAGRVTVNTVAVGTDTPGVADPARPYPWSGVYFRNVPVTVTATPDLGFAFSHWETAEGDAMDQTLVLTLTGDAAVRAVFEPTVLPRVTVNEFMADATKAGGIAHPVTGQAADWFELFNEGPAAVDLGGYWVEDNQPANACRLPDGTVLPPGGCLLVWTGADATSGTNPDGSVNAAFGLGKNGDAVALLTPDRKTELDRVTFGAQETNVSRGRWANGEAGTWQSYARPTPGLPNRAPEAVGLLPLHPVQAVAAGGTLALSLAPAAGVSAAVYTVLSGEDGAAVDGAGLFTWTPSAALASGVYAFRVGLAGILGGAAVADETTLLAAVSNAERFRIEALASPGEGGRVTGGGTYDGGATVTLAAYPEAGWRFVRWGDGLTASSRSFPARRDATYTAHFAYGLLAPEGACGTLGGDGAPLLYWQEVSGAESYVVRRAPAASGPFAVVGETASNVFRDAAPLVGVEACYTVAGRHGGSEGPACAAFRAYGSGATRKLEGAVIGTLGAYSNDSGRTRDKAFDGSIDTFYDAAADGGWPGLDFGTLQGRRLAYLRYVPRAAFPQRMVNGRFQIASVSDGTETFESPETLHTVTAQPPVGVYTLVALGVDRLFRYFRYLPPPGGWGNIAELEAYGHDAVPGSPSGLRAEAGVGSVALAWDAAGNVTGYLVRRAAAEAGPYEAVAYVAEAAFREAAVPEGETRFYRVSAVNGSGVSADSAALAAAPLAVPRFAAGADGGGVEVREGTVTLRLSGALAPRLELVCSETLEIPVAQWQPLPGASFSDPDPVTGAVTVSVATNAPRLFFAVRVAPE